MIAIGSDHGGYRLKEEIKAHLTKRGLEFEDFGCFSEESCDYPEIGHAVAHAIADGKFERGILICGTGIGISISANKVPGIRAALCTDCFTAEATRFPLKGKSKPPQTSSGAVCCGGKLPCVSYGRKHAGFRRG